jgi:hypothetical protein
MFSITPRSADRSNSGRGVCRAGYLAKPKSPELAKPPPAARLQERHKVGRRPGAGQVVAKVLTCVLRGRTGDFHANRHFNDLRCFPGH